MEAKPGPALADLYRAGVALLGGRPQALLEAKVLLLRAARLSEERFLAAPERPCSPQAEAFFRRLVGRRLEGVPLAYLTGTKEFWSIPFEVTPSVPVPRPETEVLVEKVLELSRRDKESIVDVGTGSGCIAVALAQELPKADIDAVDISERALAVARRNAARHRARRVRFLRSDLLSAYRGTGARFDFIVSNPPYISHREWEALPADVRGYEPRRALLAGESGLELIGRLVRGAGAFLKPGGYLIFEIGEGQRDRVLSLFGRRWTEIETAWDLAGKPRVITARRA
ncbi:MAG TPA: peptide chain release factor N(5)-glutamine methyltransferase [Candidatus Aminicenantes bacterium]|nr:peptide chain release factor N(5)-glutamine methyltransferase [Candidatus Aminicenantes bacterium]